MTGPSWVYFGNLSPEAKGQWEGSVSTGLRLLLRAGLFFFCCFPGPLFCSSMKPLCCCIAGAVVVWLVVCKLIDHIWQGIQIYDQLITDCYIVHLQQQSFELTADIDCPYWLLETLGLFGWTRRRFCPRDLFPSSTWETPNPIMKHSPEQAFNLLYFASRPKKTGRETLARFITRAPGGPCDMCAIHLECLMDIELIKKLI